MSTHATPDDPLNRAETPPPTTYYALGQNVWSGEKESKKDFWDQEPEDEEAPPPRREKRDIKAVREDLRSKVRFQEGPVAERTRSKTAAPDMLTDAEVAEVAELKAELDALLARSSPWPMRRSILDGFDASHAWCFVAGLTIASILIGPKRATT